jgi:hypothetical protein
MKVQSLYAVVKLNAALTGEHRAVFGLLSNSRSLTRRKTRVRDDTATFFVTCESRALPNDLDWVGDSASMCTRMAQYS